MQGIIPRVPLALGKVEFATLEGLSFTGVGKASPGFRTFEAVELPKKLLPSFTHQFGQINLMIGEEEERGGRGKFLALKKHGRAGREQEKRRQRAVSTR